MSKRGAATLPLHGGHAPRWLFDRMVDLGGAIAEVVVEEHGRRELLRRLADPYWFQAFGCVLGFDWHSSGVTTTTMGALKEALDLAECGVAVVGGKGATSRQTPTELAELPMRLSGASRERLQETSRLAATVDNACLQDSYTLYHHTMAVTEDGDWCVVQQGMADDTARRYHWLSDTVEDFVEEPQDAICAQTRRDSVLDLTARESADARDVAVDLACDDDPARLKRYLHGTGQRSLADFGGGTPESSGSGGVRTDDATEGRPHLRMPDHHQLRLSDLSERAIDNLQAAYEHQPRDFEDLVQVEGVGPGALRALALIAELVYDADAVRDDPAKYAYAHGGKDGTPHPVKRERYDQSIEEVRACLEGAEVDGETKQTALERLGELEAGD
jgi:hypothetical protein